MNKKRKILIAVLAGLVGLSVLSLVFITLAWNGAFDKIVVTDIAVVGSPDNSYSLTFQQVGDPEWPFGATHVRLTLKDRNDNAVKTVDTDIQDDGATAHEGNIKSVKWSDNEVVIILQASEMSDKEIKIAYK